MLPDKALEFMRAGKAKRRHMVRCGFELETQSTDSDDSYFDEDAYYGRISELVEDEITSTMAEVLGLRRHRNLREDVFEALREYFMEDDNIRADYYSSCKPTSPCDSIEVGRDGSVNGYEFRTLGGLTFNQFMSAADAVFDMSHEIDDKCSFHIHLSIPGVTHKYGADIQRAMVEYIALNVGRLPKTVQNRLNTASNNQYINGLVGREAKYCFVRFHPQGTWEFRCIGNVHNAEDAKICLDICIEALAHAYSVAAGESRLYWRGASSETAWTAAIFGILRGEKIDMSKLNDGLFAAVGE